MKLEFGKDNISIRPSNLRCHTETPFNFLLKKHITKFRVQEDISLYFFIGKEKRQNMGQGQHTYPKG